MCCYGYSWKTKGRGLGSDLCVAMVTAGKQGGGE